jgi:hypothetical protein
MNLGSLLIMLKLAMDSGFTVSPKTNGPTTPTKAIGDYCDSSVGLPPNTLCVNNRVQPRLK